MTKVDAHDTLKSRTQTHLPSLNVFASDGKHWQISLILRYCFAGVVVGNAIDSYIPHLYLACDVLQKKYREFAKLIADN